MSTELQKELAEAIVKNTKLPPYKRKNKLELVVSGGYSPKTAQGKAKDILEAKGVKDALKEWGLTEALITKALVEDIKKKPQKRLGELSLGAEILGLKDNEQKGNTNNFLIINSEQGERLARRYLASLTPSEEPLDRLSDSNEPKV